LGKDRNSCICLLSLPSKTRFPTALESNFSIARTLGRSPQSEWFLATQSYRVIHCFRHPIGQVSRWKVDASDAGPTHEKYLAVAVVAPARLLAPEGRRADRGVRARPPQVKDGTRTVSERLTSGCRHLDYCGEGQLAISNFYGFVVFGLANKILSLELAVVVAGSLDLLGQPLLRLPRRRDSLGRSCALGRLCSRLHSISFRERRDRPVRRPVQQRLRLVNCNGEIKILA
jgi:hypothetical protein